MILEKKDLNTVEQLVAQLKGGNVAVIPCDTVYGFSSLYITGEEKLKKLKGRDGSKPFLVLATVNQAKELCSDIPEELLNIWPAPLTAILPLKNGKTLGIRVPDDSFLQKLLEELGTPVYSTSVNFTGEPFIKSFNEIVEKYEDKVSIIVKDKEVTDSLPSTLVDFTTKPYKLLRQGSFSVSDLIEKGIIK